LEVGEAGCMSSDPCLSRLVVELAAKVAR
jgi:hypothetical protein